MIAFAGVGQMPKCPDHVFELRRAKLKSAMCSSATFLTFELLRRLSLQSFKSSRTCSNGKAEVPGAANKAKAMDIARRIIPVAAFGPACFRYQINGLVVPDHLGGDA